MCSSDLMVAQILLGSDDLEHRRRYLNAKHTIEALLEHNVIPIINENDSVTVDEIKIGDNDTLSATVACLTAAMRARPVPTYLAPTMLLLTASG